MNVGEADDLPAGESGFEVFIEVGEEALGAVVPPANPNAAFDFDEGAAWEMGEVRTPATCGMKAMFTF